MMYSRELMVTTNVNTKAKRFICKCAAHGVEYQKLIIATM